MQRIKSAAPWVAVAYGEHKSISPHPNEQAYIIVRARTKQAAHRQLLKRIGCAPENTRIRKIARSLYRLTVIYSPEGRDIYFIFHETRVKSAQKSKEEANNHV